MSSALAAALVAAALSAAPAAPAPAQGSFFPYPLKTTKLKNGLTVVRVPFDSPGLLAFHTVVRVGSRNEVEPGLTGFAHFFEHVMFKGTKTNPEGTREKLLGTLGFNENAFTSDDVTVYHLFGPSASVEQLIEVEADRFRNLEFSEQTFQTEAKAVLGEYHKSAARPELRIEETLGATAFTKHTYQHTTLGFYEDIKKMPERYAYSKEFFKRWYTPDNVVIIVVGEFDDGKLMASIEKHYGPWTGKSAQVVIPVEPPQKEERTAHIDWPGASLPRQVHAWHTPSGLKTNDAAVQNVLTAYLTGPTSPLHKELVLEKQLCEAVGSSYYDHRDPNLFTIGATLKDEKHRAEVKAAMDARVKELVDGKVDAPRVEAIKQNIRYGLLMSFETAPAVAEQLAWYTGVYGTPDSLDKLFTQISQVKPEQLSAFAKKHLTNQNRTVVTLTQKAAAPAAPAVDGGVQ